MASSRATVRSLNFLFELFGGSRRACSARLLSVISKAIPCRNSGVACFVAHDAGFAMNPDFAIVARNEAILGTETHARGAGAGELLAPTLAVVRMQLPMPEERIAQPFLLSEPEHRLDVRTDVNLVFVETFLAATP